MNPLIISPHPIVPGELQTALAAPAAGACVGFEGRVRDHNEGRSVVRLEYEAYAPLAEREGARIIAEAAERWPIIEARCVHRTGVLEIGDCAVWVGVVSPHRDEAFAACRYIIDEVKVRLPIWKKEHYADGDSGWVSCERCAAHAGESSAVSR
ncbi:MAG: molybdenum cofactor biosynthesis protein MoaE [Gammaproteobacteria bacterium]|jgi:molybdopterin synthase catalytic subunit